MRLGLDWVAKFLATTTTTTTTNQNKHQNQLELKNQELKNPSKFKLNSKIIGHKLTSFLKSQLSDTKICSNYDEQIIKSDKRRRLLFSLIKRKSCQTNNNINKQIDDLSISDDTKLAQQIGYSKASQSLLLCDMRGNAMLKLAPKSQKLQAGLPVPCILMALISIILLIMQFQLHNSQVPLVSAMGNNFGQVTHKQVLQASSSTNLPLSQFSDISNQNKETTTNKPQSSSQLKHQQQSSIKLINQDEPKNLLEPSNVANDLQIANDVIEGRVKESLTNEQILMELNLGSKGDFDLALASRQNDRDGDHKIAKRDSKLTTQPIVFTNQFVIRVEGGENEARKVAQKHGFVYLNHILDDYYHLEHARLSKRSMFVVDQQKQHQDLHSIIESENFSNSTNIEDEPKVSFRLKKLHHWN